ncbi:AAA family ATPase [Tsukamurella soli]|uniref:Toprim domain-containing protein n=1 Tax=Tsukamurella soli TaxID=644556 RepID=A0ABP8JT45_9ACTN
MTTERAIDRCKQAFEGAGLRWYETGTDRADAQAPGHSTADRSVTFRQVEGRVLVNSHADDKQAVLDAVGLTIADLYDTPGHAEYSYSDGRRVWREILGTGKKTFKQRNATGKNGLYRTEFPDGATVYVVEGEDDVHAVEALGHAATCSAMGAGKAHLFDWSPLAGHRVVIVADKDKVGRDHAAQVAEKLAALRVEHVVVETPLGDPDSKMDVSDHIAAGLDLAALVPVDHVGRPGPPQLSVVCLADVEAEPITWLWPGRIPAGKLVTLDGDPSLGKSTLALTFAGVVTNGGLWPDGTRCEYPGAVVLLSGEDGLADTVRPRLDAAHADVNKVVAVQGVALEDGTLVPPTLADVHQLGELVQRLGARLLIVDVLMAYLPSRVDSHKDQDVRRVLSALADMADRTGCTVLLLRHLNKAKGGDPMYRGGGSIGIVGAARAGMLVAADPDDPQVRVLASTKSNLGPPPGSLKYTLVSVDGTDVAAVRWLGADDRDARALLAEPESDDARDVDGWLREHLAAATDRQMKATDVFRDADANGYTKDQVKRAKKRLGVKTVKDASAWWWSLPFDNLMQGSTAADKSAGTQNRAPLLPSRSDGVQSAPLTAREQGSTSPDSGSSRASDATVTPRHDERGATGATEPDQQKQDGAIDEESQSRQAPRVCRDCGATVGKSGKCVNCIVAKAAAEQRHLHPVCDVCGKPVVGGQGTRHFSCTPQAGAA